MTQGCGLLDWMTNMQVVHATSQHPEGPFVKRDVAVQPMSTNPEAVVDPTGEWWIFHIGDGLNATQKNCNNGTAQPGQTQPRSTQVVHHAKGPEGPWTALPSVDCNNPSPALADLGGGKSEARLMCTWNVRRSLNGSSFAGPWGPPVNVPTGYGQGDPRRGARWEDPFLWQDKRGHWHVLAHVFVQKPCGDHDPASVTPSCNYISGHAFSRNGLTDWTVSPVEPFSFTIQYDDNTTGLVSTRERPKLLFDHNTGEPTHLYSAVAPMPAGSCTGCAKPRKSSDAKACIGCKTCEPEGHQVYTMVAPLRQA
jgi:hypothetical protein